jgi:uncharacterized membrane protein
MDQDERLRAIERQMAELASRIYRIEQLSGIIAAQRPPAETAATSESESAPGQHAATPSSLGDTSAEADVHEQAAKPPLQRGPLKELPVRPPKRPAFAHVLPSRPAGSVESVVGGQWLNRLGILAVLVGVSYFLKLAFENDWIGPATQVLIGLACGVGLLMWSERFRKRGFSAFGYSLKAIGLGTLYLSLWASSQFYRLVLPWAAFLGMVAVTLTAATLSLVQDSELLAAGAMVGGFLTPVLVSTNQNHEVVLLSYLLLLDLGAFWIVSTKHWGLLLAGAFVGTALLSAAWASTYYNESELATTLVFGTLFFLLFALAPFVERLDEGAQNWQRAVQDGLILANAIAYFGILFLMLWGNHRDLLAWLLLAVAAFYFGLRRLLQQRLKLDATSAMLFGGLVIAFVTVAIPVALEGRWIIFAWDAEAAVLFWLAYQAKSRVLRFSAGIVLALTILRLITDGNTETTLLFNPRFGLYLLTIAVTALLAWISLQQDNEESRRWTAVAVVLVNLLALVGLGLEVRDFFFQLVRTATGPELPALHIEEAFSYSALWMIYGAALMTLGFLKRQPFLRWQAIVLLCAAAIKVFFVDIAELDRGYRIASFIALGIVLLAVSFFYQRMRASEVQR